MSSVIADRWCDYCHGVGLVRAVRPGSDVGTLVRCACTYADRASRVLRAVHLLLARRGFPPTIREVARELGSPSSTVVWWLDSLAREGRIHCEYVVVYTPRGIGVRR